jgi:hypothetical protein
MDWLVLQFGEARAVTMTGSPSNHALSMVKCMMRHFWVRPRQVTARGFFLSFISRQVISRYV